MNEQSGSSKTKSSTDDVNVYHPSENILTVTNPEREASVTNYRASRSKFFDAVFEEHINNIDNDDRITNLNDDRNSSRIALKSIFPVRSRDSKVEEIYSYRGTKIKVQNPSKTNSQVSPKRESEQDMNMAARRFSESHSNASKYSGIEQFRKNSRNRSRDTLILKSQQMRVSQMPNIPENHANRYSHGSNFLLMRSELEIPNPATAPGAESESEAIWCKCIDDQGTTKCPKYERSRHTSFESEKIKKSISIKPNNSNSMRSNYSNSIKSYNLNSIKPDCNSIKSNYSNSVKSYNLNSIKPDCNSIKSNYSNSVKSYNLNSIKPDCNSIKSNYSNNVKSYNLNSIKPDCNCIKSNYSNSIKSYNLNSINPDCNCINSNETTNDSHLETIRPQVDEAIMELLHLYPYYCPETNNETAESMQSSCNISIQKAIFGPSLEEGLMTGLQILSNWYYGRCGDNANIQEIKEIDISMIDSVFIEKWLAREYARLYQDMEKAKEDPQATGPLSADCLEARENTLNLIAELLEKKRLLEQGILDTTRSKSAPCMQESDFEEDFYNAKPCMVDESTSPIASLCDIVENEPICCVNASTCCNIIPECCNMATSPPQSLTSIQKPRFICRCVPGSTGSASKSLEESTNKPNCWKTCTHGKEILIQCIPKNPSNTSTPYKEFLIEKKTSVSSSRSAKSKRSLSFKCTSPVISNDSSNSYNKYRDSEQFKTFDDYLSQGRKCQPSFETMSNVTDPGRQCACTKSRVNCPYTSSSPNNSKVLNCTSLNGEFTSPDNSIRSVSKRCPSVQCGSPISLRSNTPLINSSCKGESSISSRINSLLINSSCKGESPISSRNNSLLINSSCKGESPISSRNNSLLINSSCKGESPISSRNITPIINLSCKGESSISSRINSLLINSSCKGESPISSRNNTLLTNSSCCKCGTSIPPRNNTPSIKSSCCKCGTPISLRNNTPLINASCKGESSISSRNNTSFINPSCCNCGTPIPPTNNTPIVNPSCCKCTRNNTALISSSCCKCGTPITPRNNASLTSSFCFKCGSPILSRNGPSPLRLSLASSTANEKKSDCCISNKSPSHNSCIEITELPECPISDNKETISIGVQNSVIVENSDPVEMINETTSYRIDLIDNNENIPIDCTPQKIEDQNPQPDVPCECKSSISILIKDCKESLSPVDCCRPSLNPEPCRRKIPRLQILPTGGLFSPWNTCNQSVCPTALYQQRSISQRKKNRKICECQHKMIYLKGKCSNKKHDVICNIPTSMRNERCCSPCCSTDKINKHSVRIVNVRSCKSEPNICESKCAVRNVIYGMARIVKYDNFTIFEMLKSTKYVPGRMPKKTGEIYVVKTKS